MRTIRGASCCRPITVGREPSTNTPCIQIGQREPRRSLSEVLFSEMEQELERVAIGRDRSWTDGPMLLQMVDEEVLQKPGEGRTYLTYWRFRHGSFPEE
jgi:hypothetical protein